MRITGRQIRQIIRSIILETVSDNHGIFVGTLADVTWSPEKNAIPFSGNPFVGGSPAFEAWLNDGVTTRRFRKNLHVGTPDEESFLMTVDDYVKEGEWVIIPTLWSDPQYRHVYRVESIYGGPSQVRGTPPVGAYALSLCRLVRTAENGVPTRLTGVGLAFLKRVASKTKDSLDARKNAEEFMDSWTPPKTRASGSQAASTSGDAPPGAPRDPERRVIRRVGGVAAPPEPRAPRQMSGDEVRDMLGLRRLRETDAAETDS